MDTQRIYCRISATERLVATLQVPFCLLKTRQSCSTNNLILLFCAKVSVSQDPVTYCRLCTGHLCYTPVCEIRNKTQVASGGP